MGRIIWLASYPKSGNTWMRILLTNYLRDGEAPADINKLYGGPIASARAWFDEWVGVEASSLKDDVIERLRPEVYRCMAGESSETFFMKVHDAWQRTDAGEGLFPADVTAGVIYILRNPLDLAGSCANHWGVDISRAVENLCDPGFAVCDSSAGFADQLRQNMLSWSGHARSWIDDSGLDVHVVRYEDIRADAETTLDKVVCFSGLSYDKARVRKAAAFSEFSEMRRQEAEKGFRERPPKASGFFFRQGKAGSWRQELPVEIVKRVIDAHGDMMKRFGYLDENNEPI